ncbi:MAG: DegV family EDD domain-containing protein [Spirochaetales bacterium]|nr:DegV family EDD domain-containing protein [Spirochaetales bacterium]
MSAEEITGYQIYHGFLSGYRNIARHRDHIDKINVFPVADGDTGTNMISTARSIVANMNAKRSPNAVFNDIALHSLRGARGNSGMILSQFLAGFAVEIKGTSMETLSLGRAAKKAVESAYNALEEPKEGTMLTVMRIWADTLHRMAEAGAELTEVLSEAFDAARTALKKTPEQLPILAEHQVLDAGAWGFVSFIEGIQRLMREGPLPFSLRKRLTSGGQSWDTEHKSQSDDHLEVRETIRYRYCSEFLLSNSTVPSQKLRALLHSLGDSLIVGEAQNLRRIHVHTNHPAEVLARIRPFGRISEQKIDDMVRQAQAIKDKTTKVAVVTDTISDIPIHLQDKYAIHMVSIPVLWGEDEYLDRLTITPGEFYRLQSERQDSPTTSVPDRPQIERLYRFLLDHYEGILVLPVSSGLSGTYQQMNRIAQELDPTGKRIVIEDSRLNTVAQGLLVTTIAKYAAHGMGLEELTEKARDLRARTRVHVAVDSLDAMIKSGRVKPALGKVAQWLNLKPLVSLDSQGKGTASGAAFSTRKALSKVIELTNTAQKQKGVEVYAIVHSSVPNRARETANRLEQQLEKSAAYIEEVSPALGTHTGTGAVGVAYIEASNTI